MTKLENNWGGRRAGAGRKLKYGKPTQRISLPIDLVHELQQLNLRQLNSITRQLRQFRETGKTGRNK